MDTFFLQSARTILQMYGHNQDNTFFSLAQIMQAGSYFMPTHHSDTSILAIPDCRISTGIRYSTIVSLTTKLSTF
jgi:hypothetical protein